MVPRWPAATALIIWLPTRGAPPICPGLMVRVCIGAAVRGLLPGDADLTYTNSLQHYHKSHDPDGAFIGLMQGFP